MSRRGECWVGLPVAPPSGRSHWQAGLCGAMVLFAVVASRAEHKAVVVAADGSGEFRSIQEAINAAPQLTSAAETWVIRIKPGIYREQIYVMREKRFVRLVGDDPEHTIVTGSLYAGILGVDGQPIGTFRTPTMWIDADDFTVEGLTIANTAGAVGQALAVRVDGDRVVFRHCRFDGWQDTLLSNRGRHYYDRCRITGAVDFIFGGGTDYFNACEIRCIGDGYITAASTLPGDNYGFVFFDCRVTGANPGVRTYLGRPWRAFASVTFLNTEMSEVVRPEGWHNWDRPERERSSRYGEGNSRGPGAAPAARVPWAGRLGSAEAAKLKPDKVLAGRDGWNPEGP